MFRLSEATSALDARLHGIDVEVTGVSTDSRAVKAGELFVALVGERFDGHDHVDAALANGAVAAVVQDPARVKTPAAALLVVADTRLALGQLGAWWRNRFTLPIAAITGSSGKTTIKEMLAAILRTHAGADAVLATEGNLNNDIGLPLMLLRLNARHRHAVIEMGMNHLGEIAYLTRLTRPLVAAIGNAGIAHIGELGSRDAIAQAKGEIFEGLMTDGVKVINADDAYAGYWRTLATGHRTVDFGMDHPAAVSATYEATGIGSTVELRLPDGSCTARLLVPGAHNVRNALCAAAAAHVLGVPPESIAEGLGRYRGIKGRLQAMEGPHGAVLVDDTYNANPDSMKAAIDWLATRPGTRLFVMGDMGELGPDAAAMHAEIGAYARRHRIDRLLALGDMTAQAVRTFGDGARHFTEAAALAAAAAAGCGPDTTVLVKGSRFMRMERIVAALAVEPVVAEGH
ncbi:MAG: UDP-N-acetylmuramoyl-tripeptide--D-alanyl-D-alanine ligase [Burkholderiales bacterium]|nr:UDP-N-acetylmuramoyl-tripeptide--D-alanyl-D-alanine ligase [Burkholderiales bacterium]